MQAFFDKLSARLADPARKRRSGHGGKIYHCQCGQPVFFGNTECLACHLPLGYEPWKGEVLALVADATQAEQWRLAEYPDAPAYRRCANLVSPAICNWLLPADSPDTLCEACALNHTIPDLSIVENGLLWNKVESAKRRLVAQLLTIGLPVQSAAETDNGLAFDFLAQVAPDQPVMTGHDNGLITLNIEEADDARREQVRAQMHEPYRTLLGHFRHEVGHYYWDRLIDNSEWLEPFRQLFGDEREDYAEALQRHYDNGPAPDWNLHFVSAYASTHPWEDWAESWAHYLHMLDTLDTALSFGMAVDLVELEYESFTADTLWRPDDPSGGQFLAFVNAWVELTAALNELSRSMGQPDFYPFVLTRDVIGKLHFIHRVVRGVTG
jgi:hypothetical protein